MNPRWCHWMRLAIRNMKIYGLGWESEPFRSYMGGSFSREENTMQVIIL